MFQFLGNTIYHRHGFFLFSQFCNVAKLVITHESIQPKEKIQHPWVIIYKTCVKTMENTTSRHKSYSQFTTKIKCLESLHICNTHCLNIKMFFSRQINGRSLWSFTIKYDGMRYGHIGPQLVSLNCLITNVLNKQKKTHCHSNGNKLFHLIPHPPLMFPKTLISKLK